jgi:hypothetical protein
MTDLGPQFKGVSPIWKKEAREMDAVDARQAASPIHIYEGYDERNHPNSTFNPKSDRYDPEGDYGVGDKYIGDDYHRKVYAAKNGGYGRHVILGRVMFHNETGVAHIELHPDLPPAQRAVTAISMLKVADKLHREKTGRGITTDYTTSNEGVRFIKGLIPGANKENIDKKRANAIHYLLEPGMDLQNNDLSYTTDELKDLFRTASKNSRNNIKLQETYDPKTFKSNGKKTWLA